MIQKNDALIEQPDPKSDKAWLKEAQRRLEELRSGKVQGIPADVVFVRARQRFTK